MSRSKVYRGLLVILPSVLVSQATSTLAQETPSESQPQQMVDVDKMDCRELLQLDGDARSDVILFMQGFVSGQKEEMKVDLGALAISTDKAIDSCIDDPSKTLLEVFAQSR